MKQSFLIILVSIVAAVFYGIVHDQITARICLEYFTIGHPRMVASDSPTLQGLYWGVIATWWVGLILGIGLAIGARAGSRPKTGWRELLGPIGILMVSMFGFAILGGLIGFVTSRAGVFYLADDLAVRVPESKHVAFLTAGWAHSASYLAGLIGGVVLWVKTWRRRMALARGAASEN